MSESLFPCDEDELEFNITWKARWTYSSPRSKTFRSAARLTARIGTMHIMEKGQLRCLLTRWQIAKQFGQAPIRKTSAAMLRRGGRPLDS